MGICVTVWVLLLHYCVNILGMFLSIWSKEPWMKWLIWPHIYEFYSNTQLLLLCPIQNKTNTILLRHPIYILLLPPWNNMVVEKLWRNKSPRGSGNSKTGRTLASQPQCQHLPLLPQKSHFTFSNKARPRKNNGWVCVSILIKLIIISMMFLLCLMPGR